MPVITVAIEVPEEEVDQAIRYLARVAPSVTESATLRIAPFVWDYLHVRTLEVLSQADLLRTVRTERTLERLNYAASKQVGDSLDHWVQDKGGQTSVITSISHDAAGKPVFTVEGHDQPVQLEALEPSGWVTVVPA